VDSAILTIAMACEECLLLTYPTNHLLVNLAAITMQDSLQPDVGWDIYPNREVG